MPPVVMKIGADFDEQAAREAAKEAQRYWLKQEAQLKVDAQLAKDAAKKVAGEARTALLRQSADLQVEAKLAQTSARQVVADAKRAGADAARQFTKSFEAQADPRVKIDAKSPAANAGGEAGDSFGSGFAGAAGLARLGGAGGPIAAAIAGGVLAGIKVVGPQIQAAMAKEFSIDLSQARLGLDDSSMKNVANGAAQAFASNWGASIEANLGTATSAFQSGLISAASDPAAIQQMIGQLTDVSTILGEDIPSVARSAAQAIRTGIASDATGAFDLLVAGQQRGLNVSNDWLDTLNEYGTQFRKLGLTGPEAIGLLSQALQGGARDTDVAADALKEFSIRVVDGSKSTTDAFTALNLNADEMARRFSAGGRTSATAFDQVVDKIRAIKDPVEQSRIAVQLFGTQAEDLGSALNAFDLSTAVNEFGNVEGASQRAADTMVKNSQNEWAQAGRNIQSVIAGIRDSLDMGDWFNTLPRGLNELFTPPTTPTPGAPGVPAVIGQTPGAAVAPPAGPATGSPLDVFAPTRVGAPALPPRAPAPPPPAAPTPAPPSAPVAPAAAVPASSFTAPSASRFSDQNLQPNAARANDLIAAAFPQITDIGGWRKSDPFPDHPSGRALDIMIPGEKGLNDPTSAKGLALGNEINAWLIANKDAIGLVSTIWQKKDHFNHIHALFAGGPQSGTGQTSAASPLSATTGPAASGGVIPVWVTNFDQQMMTTSGGNAPSAVAPGAGGGPDAAGGFDPLGAFFKGLGNSGGWGGLAGNIGTNIMAQVRGTDTVPAMLTPGEFVVNANAARQFAPQLQAMNGFQTGGFVPGAPPPPPPMPTPPPKPPSPTPPPSTPPPGMAGPGVGSALGKPQGPSPKGHQGTTVASSGGGGGAIGAAAGMFPGGGVAAQLGMRSAEFGGQLAGIGISGLLETFLPAGSALGSPENSWLGRAASAISKTGPAKENTAGVSEVPHRPVDPNTTQHGTGGGQAPGPGIHIENMNNNHGSDGTAVARDIDRQVRSHGSGMGW